MVRSRLAVCVVLVATGCGGEDTGQSRYQRPVDAGGDGEAGSVRDSASDVADTSTGGSGGSPTDAQVDTPVEEAAVCQGIVTINEVQTASTGADGGVVANDEFVELYVAAECPLDVSQFNLVYYPPTQNSESTTLWTAIAGMKLAPGQYFVVGGSQYSHGAPDFPFPADAGLGEEGGSLVLRQGGLILDVVAWGTVNNPWIEGEAADAPSPDESVGRYPDGLDSENNKADFKRATPTPRAANQQ